VTDRPAPDLADDLSLALAIASDADLVSLERFRAQDLIVETKPDATPVTDADRAVERLIRDRIEASRPGDRVLGEEFGGEASREGRLWIVDPIDGTKNFLRGVPIWGTMIALAIDGEPVVGVVSAPALHRRWWGARGLGAWAEETGRGTGASPARLAVSGVAELADASVSHGSLQMFDGAGRLDELIALSRRVWRTRSYGDVWQYMLLAEGSLDAVIEFDLKPHDLAAHLPIIREAGGRVTSLDDEPAPWSPSVVATNGRIHDAVAAMFRRDTGANGSTGDTSSTGDTADPAGRPAADAADPVRPGTTA